MVSLLRAELLCPLMAFICCSLSLASHLAAKSAESSILDSPIFIEVSHQCNKSSYTTQCNGIWNCAEYLCNLTRPNSLFLSIKVKTDIGECTPRGISWIWEWKTSRSSVLVMFLAIPFELLAIISIISRKPYRCLVLRKKQIFVILSVISCSLLTIAEILEDAWTIQVANATGDKRPFFVQTWNTILSISLLLNLYFMHIFALSRLDFNYEELG